MSDPTFDDDFLAHLGDSPEMQALRAAGAMDSPSPAEPATAEATSTPAGPAPEAPVAASLPAAVPGVPGVTGVPGVAGMPVPVPGLTIPATATEPLLPGARPVVPVSAVVAANTSDDRAYTRAGALTSEQVITGDPMRFAHLDDRITATVEKVQNDLVGDNLADQLVHARFDAAIREKMATEIDRLALKHLLAGRGTTGNETALIVATVVNEIIGLGPLEPLWDDPTITEVIVNGPNDVYVEQAGRLVRATGVRFRSQDHLTQVCQRILAPLNRKLDVKDPLADGRLPDGSRVNAVHAAIAPNGPLLTIRRFPQVNRSLVDLVDLGAMTEDMAALLAWLVANKASTLVCGGTGTGKTTMLNALSAAIPRHERVVTIEDSLELRLHPSSHVAAMEARPTDASGSNAVPIRALVKNALRMRPDRIIVGEIRDQAALDMLQACNTGHEGSMSTVHANGPNEAVARLAVMVAQGGEIPADKVDWLVGSALDLIVMIRRFKDGSRRISGIYEVPEAEDGHRLKTIPLWEWERTGEDDNGRLLGEYRQVNELSEQLRAKLGLDYEPLFTFEQVRALVQ